MPKNPRVQHGYDAASETGRFLVAKGFDARVAIVLGSGLGEVTGRFRCSIAIPYKSIPHFPVPSAEGHGGVLSWGRINGTRVAVLEGRVHLYEGNSPASVIFPVRALALAGVETFVLTCAAGGIAPQAKPGTFMVFKDHINLQGLNPLLGAHDARWGQQFVDLTNAYDLPLRRITASAASTLRSSCFSGVYASLLGPTYETPAEIQALKRLGADAVGMSTVPEVMAARQLGRRVLAIALISNRAAGLSKTTLSHKQVLEVGRRASGQLADLLEGVIAAVQVNVKKNGRSGIRYD